MTRIAIDYTSAVRQSAGIGRYTRGLVGALAELEGAQERGSAANSYVLYSAGRGLRARAWPGSFALRELPLSDRHLAIVWQRLRLPLPVELVTGRVDILHSPDFVLPPVWRARRVLTVHDLSFIRHPECSSPPLLAYLMHAVPRSVRQADLLLADSQATRQDLIELLGVPAERVVVLYPGLDDRFVQCMERFRRVANPAEAGAQAALQRYGIREPFILGLGTLQPRKNFRRLIRAFDLLRRRHAVPHQLVIAGGRGWLYEEIEKTVLSLGLQEAVLMAGFVADEDLPTLYRAADVFAFPSLYEGFGFPVLEAMACGTPVVTSRASSLPEVAGEAALLVAPEDVEELAQALWRLISDVALRDELVSRGFQQCRRFSWQQSASELLRIYAHVAHGSPCAD